MENSFYNNQDSGSNEVVIVCLVVTLVILLGVLFEIIPFDDNRDRKNPTQTNNQKK